MGKTYIENSDLDVKITPLSLTKKEAKRFFALLKKGKGQVYYGSKNNIKKSNKDFDLCKFLNDGYFYDNLIETKGG